MGYVSTTLEDKFDLGEFKLVLEEDKFTTVSLTSYSIGQNLKIYEYGDINEEKTKTDRFVELEIVGQEFDFDKKVFVIKTRKYRLGKEISEDGRRSISNEVTHYLYVEQDDYYTANRNESLEPCYLKYKYEPKHYMVIHNIDNPSDNKLFYKISKVDLINREEKIVLLSFVGIE